jgi:hypothetical protein
MIKKQNQRKAETNSQQHKRRTSAEERNKLTISHQLGNLLVLSAGNLDIVDCHHDGEELSLY